jgi:uncharacterized protein
MKTPLYETSVPVFIRMLGQLAKILDKAAADAEARKIDPAALLACRLAADMYPLVKQVQIATDAAVDGAARLAGVEAPAFDDNERSFAELGTRIAKAISFLRTLGPEQFEDASERVVSWKARDATISVKGTPYLLNHALPKFYFHVTMVYAILRHEGVALRKGDFMGKA